MRSHARRPTLSVIVVSREGPALFRALNSLSAAAARVDGDVEVVVAFDGVVPRLPEASTAAGFLFTLRHLAVVRSGSPATRNAGWRSARSDLLLFVDDDLIASPTLISGHLEAQAANPGALVVGRVIEVPDPLTAWGEHEQVAVERRWRRPRDGKQGPLRVSMSNASVSRACMEKSGGFAGWMPSEEDIELGFRLQSSGTKVVFAPDAYGERRSRRGFPEWRALARTRGRLDVAIYRKSEETGGIAALMASFQDRHPLNRSVIRLAFRSPGVERSLLDSAAWIGLAAHRIGLKRMSRAGLSVVANVEYWSGVREGLRGRESFDRLLAASAASSRPRPASQAGR